MRRDMYRYQFSERVPLRDVQEMLSLATLATECLHGRSRVRLDASFCLEEKSRSCVLDAGTPVGQDIARIFTGFLSRDLGEEAYRVHRIDDAQPVPGSSVGPSASEQGGGRDAEHSVSREAREAL